MDQSSTDPDGVRLVTAATAAEWLATTPNHILRLAETGRLPHRRVGRFVRFAPADLEEFIAAARVERRGVSS